MYTAFSKSFGKATLTTRRLSTKFSLPITSITIFQLLRGREEFKQWALGVRTSWAKGFPDYRIAIEDLVAEDDKVAKRWTFRGTHTGEFMGIAPTQKQVMMRAVTIYCFSGGMVKEIWWNYDAAGLIQQLRT